MYLYKYRPIDYWTLRGLNDETIHFQCPLEYNDPFDCPISMPSTMDENEAKKLADKSGQTVEIIQEVIKKLSSYSILSFSKYRQLLKNYRITCFSETPVSILMWSHYANNHKGICLKFKTETYDKSEYLRLSPKRGLVIKKVNYVTEILRRYKSENSKQELEEMWYRKSKDWAYEKEWRIVTKTESLKKNNDPKYFNKALVGIIFGLNCSNRDIDLVKKTLAGKQIKFYQIQLVKNKFQISVVPE